MSQKLDLGPYQVASTLNEKTDLVCLIMTRDHDYMTLGKVLGVVKLKMFSYLLSLKKCTVPGESRRNF